MKNEDALCYGQEIIAIGDGKVVDCYNTADWRAFPSDDPESDWVHDCICKATQSKATFPIAPQRLTAMRRYDRLCLWARQSNCAR
jgi:hypothetical protein